MLTPEQAKEVKKQIIQQIETTFPEDKKEQAKTQLEAMNSEQLEQFLKQNNLVKSQQQTEGQGCIFCSIVFGDVPSHKIDENSKAIAVLEINPISKGHTLVIPKEHISSKEKLPKSILTFAEKISKKIKEKLNPKDITLSSSNLFGHEVISILPIYENETPNSERKQAKPEELEELQKTLLKKTIEKTTKTPKTPKTIEKTKAKPRKKTQEKIWLPKRIP